MGQLDEGIGKLSGGAGQLSAGATKASDGSKLLRDGAGKLSGGLGQLSGGALELDNGAGQILDGQKALRDGLLLLESGVKTLPESVRTELASNASYQALLAGMQKVVDGIGKPTDVTNPATGQPATLFGGLNAIRAGLLDQVKPCCHRRDNDRRARQVGCEARRHQFTRCSFIRSRAGRRSDRHAVRAGDRQDEGRALQPEREPALLGGCGDGDDGRRLRGPAGDRVLQGQHPDPGGLDHRQHLAEAARRHLGPEHGL
jgi:X-X-X-Leu-X-X-Gly heptad repeat protein